MLKAALNLGLVELRAFPRPNPEIDRAGRLIKLECVEFCVFLRGTAATAILTLSKCLEKLLFLAFNPRDCDFNASRLLCDLVFYLAPLDRSDF